MSYFEKDAPCYLLLNIFLENNPVFQEEFQKAKGIEKLYEKCLDKK
jgi:hypothetical protein